ncbi:uncharacterized protein LOC142320003 [Lycorma delicatula]|uniref:uncharacterized protein LOC142320003 n=1 Tax=Lycorma delicatula TaxID=130591 RepID=UPI003F50F086
MKDPSVLVESTQENNEWDLLSTKRSIEWLAMHYITNAVRCQGRLTPERRELLKRVSSFFGISNDRYQAEIRRALSDKCLSAIAELVEGPNTEDEWMQEGRNSVPCVPKGQPPTIYTEYADEIARLFNESDVDDDDDADDDDDINDYEEETRSDDLKTGVLGILEPKSDICGTQVVVEDPTFQFTQLWGVKYEDSECVFSQSTHYDTDTSSGQESQSTVSESELSSMSTAQATSNDEKPLVKEVEVENAAEVEEKNVVIEVISDEESRESFIKKELDEDSSKKQLTPTTLKPEDKDGNDNLRKRKASFDGPPPIPQKLPAGSLPKISTVAVTTRAVNLQPNYKFSISNPVNSRTSVAVTPAAQKVIIVSSAGAVNNPSILQRSLCSTVVKMATTIATTPVLSTVSHVQPVTSSAVTVKQKPKTVSIPAKCRDPIVIRSQNIQLKSSPSVSHCSQDVSLKRIPVSGISTAAKILTKSGACGKSGEEEEGMY